MKVEWKETLLKDGRKCILRNALPDDAEAMIEYLKITADETPYLLRYPEEVTYTIELEREILERFLNIERDLMLVAEVDGELAGNCSMSCVGNKIRTKHRCSIGIALFKPFWGLGIGTGMFELMISKAKEVGYEQAELEVVSCNERAIALYQNMGFVKYGERPHGLKYKDGTYANELLMIKYL